MDYFDEYEMEEKTTPKGRIFSIVGSILALIIGIVFVILLLIIGILPKKLLVILCIVIALFLGLSVLLGLSGKKSCRIISLIISILMILGFSFGSYALLKTNSAMEQVSSTKYKLTGMVVAVRADDPATDITAAKNYVFGIQTSTDQNNTQLMVENVSQAVGQEIQTVQYAEIGSAFAGLMDGSCDALIYNEALGTVLAEQVEGAEDKVRILYRYEIQSDLADLTENQGLPMSFNVYVSGIDVEGDISKVSRSDVNIIVTINRKTHDILLTSTPRDYFVQLPGISGEARDKLTHAGIYGVDVSMATLAQLYDTEIPYFVRLNFTGLMNIVDIIGGIDVYSEYAFTTSRNGKTYSFSQGMNHMDGEAALAFSRERYSFESGDNQRGKNQQAVLTALIQKALDPSILLSAFDILDQVSSCVQTNMSRDEMAEFINGQLESGASWDIQSQQATGTGDKQITFSAPGQVLYVMWPDEYSVAGNQMRIKEVLEE